MFVPFSGSEKKTRNVLSKIFSVSLLHLNEAKEDKAPGTCFQMCILRARKVLVGFEHWPSGSTAKPAVSEHPKCKAKVVAYRKWSLTGSGRLQEVVAYRKSSRTGSGRLQEVVAYERSDHRES